MCQKLMVTYGAFQVLCDLMKQEEAGDLQEMAMDSILALGHNMHTHQVSRHRRQQCSVLSSPFSKRFPPKLDFSFKDLSLSDSEVLPFYGHESKNMDECQPVKTYCRYLDTDHNPFDMTITMHTTLGRLVKLPVHKATLMEESDVFRVMLAGDYREASCGEVHIHSVPHCGFLSVVHHVYGCSWQCKAVLAEVMRGNREEEEGERSQMSTSTTQQTGDDMLSEATDFLVKEIMAGCKSKEEALRAEHCLQVLACAGRFLLPELILLCEHTVVRYMEPANMAPLFHFAQLHQCFCLSESCVRAMVSMPHSHQRTKVFRDLVTSSEGESALQIILLFLMAPDL